MRKTSSMMMITCLTLGICVGIPATAQTANSTVDQAETAVVPSPVVEPVNGEVFYAIQGRPVLRRHVILPASAPANPGQPRLKPKLRVAAQPRPYAVKTGTGIVYTCASNVPTTTCNYLNTTVAGYYNNIFENANANIYIQFGTTGLGQSVGFINLVHYTPYVTALTNKAVKSSIQASALSSINTYATPAYGTQNLVEISVALGTALGFTGLAGINAAETASCTPYTSGCYNEIITVADAASQAQGGFTLYYDDQGGTEAANQYDFYAVVQHETDEVLGTSSCISTQSSSGLTDECDGVVTGSKGVPSVVDLLRYSSPGKLALDTAPSTTAGQYYSFDGGVHYGIGGDGALAKVYNTLDNGDDFADYISSSPDCGTNQAVQDAEGCPGEDAGLTVVNDGQSEITILNTDGYDIPEAVMSSPTPGSTLSGSSQTFTWSAVNGAADYAITVGTTGVGSSNIYATPSPTGGPATSQAVTGLPTSGTIYVRVFSYVGGFWTSVDFTYTGGSSSAPTISLSPTTLTFASTTVGSTSAAQTVTVKNTGTAAATLTSETLTGTNASSYLISAKTCTTTLAAAASCTVSIELKPAAAGTLTASLSVADNATGSPQTVSLKGTGVAPTETISLSPATLTFASTSEGTTSAAQTVTVKNTGTGAVTLTSETLTGTSPSSYLISAKTCTTTLAVGASCTVSIEFKPAAAGTLTASLSVADNATGSPQKVSLTGTGAAPNSVTLTPASITFPNTVAGTASDAQVVTLTNTGSAAVTISSVALTGTNPTDFVELNGCGSSLAAHGSCSIYVAFAPASAAAFSAKLSITDTATGSPQAVALSGTGTAAPSVKLSTTAIAFPTTTHGTTSAPQAVTLTNLGTATLDLTSIALTGTNPTDFEALSTCGPTLAAGASCTVYVAFKPASAAAFTAKLSIADNGASSPQSVTLSGTGK